MSKQPHFHRIAMYNNELDVCFMALDDLHKLIKENLARELPVKDLVYDYEREYKCIQDLIKTMDEVIEETEGL